ncbi:MAG: hypothetical protein JWL95_2532 [Gemmatimonadetes bacterium]|nr:hypothetical protein [Gemmatimonadota bacterium]
MVSSRRVRGWRVVLVASAIAGMSASGLACNGAEKKGPDTAKGATAPVSSQATSAPRPAKPKEQYLGRLPKPLGKMSPTEFSQLVDTVEWSGSIRKRRCTEAGCEKGLFTTVSIMAIEDADQVNPDSLPDNGVIVGVMQNLGQYTEAKYNMPPRSGQWYLLWIKAHNGERQLHFVKRGVHAGVAPLLSDQFGHIIKCKHPGDNEPRLVRADFRDCPRAGLPQNDSLRREDTADRPTAGAWLTCSQGCCTTDYPVGGVIP